MSTVRGVIYDCDGVLFDSKQANLAYYRQVLTHFGLAPPADDDVEFAEICHTYASDDVYRLLLGPSRIEAARAFAVNIDLQPLLQLMIPEDGMPGVLASLGRNLRLALATNRGTSVQAILEHFHMARYFDKVVTSLDVTRPKPSPDMLLLALQKLGLRADEVWYVGDSELDRQAAAGAGLRFVAYKGAVAGDLVIQQHAELLGLLGLG